MKFPRRQFLHLDAGTAALPMSPRFAWAQVYPSRAIAARAAAKTPAVVGPPAR
jgi:hypothetical protein